MARDNIASIAGQPVVQTGLPGIQAVGTLTRRAAAILHRSGVSVPDVLQPPGIIQSGGVTITNGVLVPATSYSFAAAAGNRWGPTTAPNIGTTTPGATNNALRLSVPSVSGADYYDIFLSTDAQPKWVARMTESQRAAGCSVVTFGAAPTAGAVPGSIDIGAVGTGVANNANPFVTNNAWTPHLIAPVISCAGFSTAIVQMKAVVADLRVLSVITVLPFFQNELSAGDWHYRLGTAAAFGPGAGSAPLAQETVIACDGSSGMAIALAGSLAGQGLSVSVWVQLLA